MADVENYFYMINTLILVLVNNDHSQIITEFYIFPLPPVLTFETYMKFIAAIAI